MAAPFSDNTPPLLSSSSSFSRTGSESSINPSSFQNATFTSESSGHERELEELGFQRSEMYQLPLVGTVDSYERHLFLCYKNPESWPSHVEASEFDRLPRLLAAAIKSRKNDIKKKTRLTICEGRDGTEASNGDVLIFPDMIRYRGLTHFDVDSFVEDVIVKGKEWLSRTPDVLTGSHVFVCAHGSRDRRCGFCGPVLVKKFKEEVEARQLSGQVFISPCSHIGGHKYAGNVIIFCLNIGGEVTGHWYGYVTPADVSVLLDQHMGKGEVVDRLWRGQMGLSKEEQKRARDQRLQLIGNKAYANGIFPEKTEKECNERPPQINGVSCCGEIGKTSCCQDGKPQEVLTALGSDKKAARSSIKNKSTRGKIDLFPWLDTWEREDTFAALAVIGAVASVTVAYCIYKRSH
ncbi:hypothetical protein AMTR_s00049p00194600 [Amborella trichopoda]|uniref:Uncharacterized protein n=2 Tax=Amborella trichopoda TaxID=13333 RepID=W1Q0W3_AMBTC|nr:hypothetical protein AMTR_s00049p00194600 [Amborella trichopoda]